MKYLYALTSNEHDYYLEQAFLSMTSLRMQMPNASISLLVDNNTEKTLTGKRKAILDLVDEFKPLAISDKFGQKARSRWLKTSMRQNIEGDFLYIDGDTIIAEDLSCLKNMNIDIGAVFDSHIYLAEKNVYFPEHSNIIKALCPKLGINPCFNLNVYFNGGIIFCKDNKIGHDFFNEWHRLWLGCFEFGGLLDQPSLNLSNFIFGSVIKELDGVWNCQILDDGALRYLHNAKIIHYMSSRPGEKAFIPANDEFIRGIKETGIIDQNMKEAIKNAKSLFLPNTRLLLLEKSSQAFYHSAFCGAAKRIFSTNIGKAIEFMLSKIRKRLYTPLRKKFSKR